MPDLRLDPREYCAPPAASFWDWNYVDDTLEWKAHHATIAFRPELEQVLRALARGGSGLPPLSLVLLVLAACRDSWDEMAASRAAFVTFARNVDLEAPDIGRLEDGLNKIARLSPELRHPIEAKALLLRFLFETGGTCLVGEQALAVCDRLMTRQVSWSGRYGQLRGSRNDLCAGVMHLLGGLERLDEQTLRSQKATGLDDLVRPAEISPENWKQTRLLISELLDDDELGGIARLARALMAVVHLPRPLCQPEELPMGGFSDIENRGSLDRLLLSELAYDDLTLAVRIALNEALYLRREAPPTTPSLARSILIDVGIRMWGIPRVFATSVALALLATTDRHAVTTAYRAQGTHVVEADLTTRQGLTQHLGCLTPDVHPGRSLAPFLAALNQRAGQVDGIVVTSEEAAADREFVQCVARQDVDSLYLATVNRSGDFRLVHQGAHGRKLICEAKLALDDILLQRDRRNVPLIDAGNRDRLPAIFYEDPFPLLIPCNQFNGRRSWVVPGYGVFEIARDQRLLWWNTPGRGPEQVISHVPGKALLVWGDNQVRANQWIAVLGQPGSQFQLLTVDIERRSVRLTTLDLECSSNHAPYSFCRQEGGLLAITKDHVEVLSGSGEFVTRLPVQWESATHQPGRLEHRGGRFFVEVCSGAWYALSLNSPSAGDIWQKVFEPRGGGFVDLVTMFDWIGHEGPVGITRQGELYFPEDGREARLCEGIRGPIEVLDVSPCGEWVLIEERWRHTNRYFVSLSSGDRHPVTAAHAARQLATDQWVRRIGRHLHWHFKAAGTGSGGQLAIVTKSNQVWTMELHKEELRFQPHAGFTMQTLTSVRPFDQRVELPNANLHLNRATWQDGSQMYLDSRGLLHLRSSDHRIPEATLVLANGATAGWTAGQGTWGNQYFTGNATNAGCRHVCAEVLGPFVERLR